ncbi:MAG: OadG family protein [Treponema sp.]|nr:OadG family protein [Treponema sp.]
MTILDMLGQSAILTVLGVGIVFLFLLIVVIVVSQFGRVFKTALRSTELSPISQVSSGVKPQVIAAISAAISEHRKSN